MTEAAPASTADLRPCSYDPGEETRLRCSQCGTPICPKCMVSYEAGFKCRNCVKDIQTHVTAVGPRHLLMGFGCSVAAGLAYGWFYPVLTTLPFFRFFGIPVLGLLAAFLIGKGVGNLIYSMTGYKLGRRIMASVLVGILAGLVLSPFSSEVLYMQALIANQPEALGNGTTIFLGLIQPMVSIIAALLFVRGIVSPYQKK